MTSPGLAHFDRPAVEQFLREWEALFDRGDHARMAAFYAEDAQLIATQIETVEGRPAIASFWRAACEGARAAGLRRTVRMTDMRCSGALAYIRGEVQLHHGDAPGPVRVRYVTLWTRDDDGVWRLSIDISSAAPR
jgi:uncharacterized protein (TIGR02246 family)